LSPPSAAPLLWLVDLQGWGGDDNDDVNLIGYGDDDTTPSLNSLTAIRVPAGMKNSCPMGFLQ